MKLLFVLLTCFCSSFAFAQKDTTIMPPAANMKQYWFVLLVKGKERDKIMDTAVIANLQKGHMANITKLYNQGKLTMAGPFGDDGNWRGIFIFDCQTKEEVVRYLSTDPAIAAGRLDYEIHPWWSQQGTVLK